MVRSRAPLDLVLADFSTASLAEFELEIATVHTATRYAAPETVAGTFTVASDWWSFGVILLEMITQGRSFEGVNDRAFRLHLVTRGLRVPDDVSDQWRELLMGLLTRDPNRRWRWPQVERWLQGERGIPHGYGTETGAGSAGPAFTLGDAVFTSHEAFALAAADPERWEAASEALKRGAIATWLEARRLDAQLLAQIRRIAGDEHLDDDARLGLALVVLNRDLPLCCRGDIVTPHWLLADPERGAAWVEGSLPSHLRRLEREPWIVRLRDRADRIRARIAEFAIPVDAERLRIALLATSTPMLETHWREKRRLFPEAVHAGVGVLMERRALSDEELIILISASTETLRPAHEIMAEALRLAAECGLPGIDAEMMRARFDCSRRDIFEALNERLRGFTRCGQERLDEWADSFRLERRLPLAQVLVLLAVPSEQWKKPPQQDYVQNVLAFFRRRLVSTVQRGPLVRLLIGRTSARLDLNELGTPLRPGQRLLDRVLQRTEAMEEIDPSAFLAEPAREERLRRLVHTATTYRRDTGIDALYLAFPTLVMRESRIADAKPRIAPVLLWPVRIDAPPGRHMARLGFDRDREEVRLNPAFEALLGPQQAAQWRLAADDLLARDHLRVEDVMDVFGTLAPVESRTLQPMPTADVKAAPGQLRLRCSAAVFLCDFSGQTIAEDLEHLARRPAAGTALEIAIRAKVAKPPGKPESVPESQQFFTVDADPSQRAAVFQARQEPGLVVQGPPGTGKSQTIVNIISDCIGRDQRVLVVCQKQAALKVVRKRLEAEGLGERLFLLEDTTKDRRPTLIALRDQLDAFEQQGDRRLAQLRGEREALARRIEAIEAVINEHNDVLHRLDDRLGLSYRDIIEELLAVEAGETLPVAAPALRPVVGAMSRSAVADVCETSAPLAPVWRDARFEGSPLHALRPFGADASIVDEFLRVFHRVLQAEKARHEELVRGGKIFSIDDAQRLRQWLELHEARLRSLADTTIEHLARWYDIFSPVKMGDSAGVQLRHALEGIGARLGELNPADHDLRLYGRLAAVSIADLRFCEKAAGGFLGERPSWMSALNLFRMARKRRLNKVLDGQGMSFDGDALRALNLAARLELSLRSERAALDRVRQALGYPVPTAPETLLDLRRATATLLDALKAVEEPASCMAALPAAASGPSAVRSGQRQAYLELIEACHRSLRRHVVKHESADSLLDAGAWFDEEWVTATLQLVAVDRDGFDRVRAIAAALPTVPAFQNFRARARGLNETAIRVLSLLRSQDGAWRNMTAARLPIEIRRTVWREALLSWKASFEERHPALLIERQEFEEKVKTLAALDRKMRNLNQDLLKSHTRPDLVARRSEWDDIVMLTGPRARRLREVVERGDRLGLFTLRPVWLMNPDMVSRLFPLRQNLFDVVIFDEASQLPVESALPALYRAHRMVVSGDEKQLPPSNFFNSRFASDEDVGEDWLDTEDGEVDSTTQKQREQSWNRREVKDCDDLLALAQTVLPHATLEIHYRSRYRQLVAFSNAAFYAHRLSVPAQHPASEIARVRPIEVRRVDSVYERQVNCGEASGVVDLLQETWRSRKDARPSIGVVTFNLKQADLIYELIEERAERSSEFRAALEQEESRVQNGEDMSFFVKNLENVQGDERDWIVFSTTFGLDAAGGFRRNFGVLGQQGGERRLNVAVTRAREKVVLVTSLPTAKISTFIGGRRRPHLARDYLQAYVDYAEKLSDGHVAAAETSLLTLGANDGVDRSARADTDDRFAGEVAAFLVSQGFTPVPGRSVDAFQLDLAIADPRTGQFGIGVECDPPRHALLATARARELWRPSVLKNAVARVHRVWSRAWYQDRLGEQQRLLAAVHEALRA